MSAKHLSPQSDAPTVLILTGEASASTMWDNQAWSYVHKEEEEEEEETEPPFLAQDFIHATQPGARIIVMLRDPVERYTAKNAGREKGKTKKKIFCRHIWLDAAAD